MNGIRACLIAASTLAATAAPAGAETFRYGELEGLLDFSFAYGFTVRTQERDEDQIGIGNGGTLPSVNGDDGTLNYDVGLTANQIRATGELTLAWREFGAYVRGYGFYDFENQLGDREHRKLSSDALRQVGSGGGLQDAYASARFDVLDVPSRSASAARW